MKKILSILLIAVCLCILPANRTQAAADPNAERFQGALNRLDYFYDYNYDYMISAVAHIYAEWDEDMWRLKTIPAAEYDAVLHKYFVLTDRQIQELREYGNQDYSTEIYDEETWEVIEVIPFFDEVNQTYSFTYYGGFGGILPEREYLGYVKNGDTYDVYYHHIRYAFLQDYLPEGVDVWEYMESLDYPEYIDLEGLRFQNGPDGYFTILGYDDYGRKYTVEYNEDVVRIISCVDYTASDLPSQFSDRTEVTIQIPEDSGIVIPDNDHFPGGTVVSAEIVSNETVTNAMAAVAEKYVAYDFTATLDGQQIQPTGTLEVTFALPADFSTDVAVYYMADTGTLEAQTVTVDAETRTVTTQLTHFSIYILVDNATKPHVHSYESAVTAPTCTQDGYTTYTCACGHSYTDTQVAAIGHSFGQWAETKAPTYTEEGEEKRTCDGCGQEETRAISKLIQTETQPSQPNQPSQPTQETTPAGDGEQADEGNSSLVWILLGVAAVVVVVAVVLIIRKKK